LTAPAACKDSPTTFRAEITFCAEASIVGTQIRRPTIVLPVLWTENVRRMAACRGGATLVTVELAPDSPDH
jgi:hypothetical protein